MVADVRLMFGNCYVYNHRNDALMAMARELHGIFDDKFGTVPSQKSYGEPYKLAIEVTKEINQLMMPMNEEHDIDEWLEKMEPITTKVQVEIATRQQHAKHNEAVNEHQKTANNTSMEDENVKKEIVLIDDECYHDPPTKRPRSNVADNELRTIIPVMTRQDKKRLQEEVDLLPGK